MGGPSLESSRPIMAPSVSSARNSYRFSTYSTAPSLAPTFRTNDSATMEIKEITDGLDKLENKKLSSQRFVPSEEKSTNLAKLALGAKLERALDRRLDKQDAVMRKKTIKSPEKAHLSEKEAIAA